MIEVADGSTEEWFVRPEELGLERAPLEAIAGGTPGGERGDDARDPRRRAGPARDMAVLNAGATIMVAGGADDLADGIGGRRDAIDSGRRAGRPRRPRGAHD